ncbi:MAG: hypothetical protein FWE16_06110, partial [Firmicutes bacterium]|nr:hypothetical protein [Bacillota bacterium]
ELEDTQRQRFLGWRLGTAFIEGNTFTVTQHTTFYPMWEEIPSSFPWWIVGVATGGGFLLLALLTVILIRRNAFNSAFEKK